MALLFIENGSALYYKDKNMIRTKKQYEKLVIEDNKLTENEYAYADEMDLSRIRSHVMNEVKEEEEKYEQLEFEFDEDLVAPI